MTHPPLFAALASAYPRTSEVIVLARRLAHAENPDRLREQLDRAWYWQRLPRFNNYRQGMDD